MSTNHLTPCLASGRGPAQAVHRPVPWSGPERGPWVSQRAGRRRHPAAGGARDREAGADPQRDDLEQAQDELAQTRAELQAGQGGAAAGSERPAGRRSPTRPCCCSTRPSSSPTRLIDEGMQSARDLMVAARTHQREIVSPGATPTTGESAGRRPCDRPRPDRSVSAEIEDVRTFARVAQVQFRAVLDALNEQVNASAVCPTPRSGPRSRRALDAPAWTGAANGHRG